MIVTGAFGSPRMRSASACSAVGGAAEAVEAKMKTAATAARGKHSIHAVLLVIDGCFGAEPNARGIGEILRIIGSGLWPHQGGRALTFSVDLRDSERIAVPSPAQCLAQIVVINLGYRALQRFDFRRRRVAQLAGLDRAQATLSVRLGPNESLPPPCSQNNC